MPRSTSTSAVTLMGLVSALAVAGCSRETKAPEPSLDRPAYTTADLADDAQAHVPGMIVVDFKDGTTKAQFDEWEKAWGVDLELADQAEGPTSAITLGHVDGDDAAEEALLARIRQDPNVEAAEPLMTLHASYQPNDPGFGDQWNLKMIHMPEAWEVSRGKGVVVAVLDTGIAYEDHDDFRQVPDLKGVKFVEGYDFVNDDTHANDDHGHGTHVAGTIAQATNNGEGVAGVAFEATLMPVKVLDHFGSGTTAAISDAIRWAVDHGAKVLNLSLGGGGRSAVMEHAVEYARAHGAVVVCAAGNGGRGVVEFPAAYPGSVAVAAVGPTGERAPYSSWGKELDVAAPGGDKSRGEGSGIVQNTIDPTDVSKSVYASYQGTSMATPHVAAVAALLWAAGAKNPDQVEQALFASAHPPKGATGWTEQFGHGVIDAQAALKALKARDATLDLLPPEAQLAHEHHDAQGSLEAAAIGTFAYGPTEWQPLAWSAALLALVLLTLGRKERPGLFNVLASPGFLIPLVMTTMGVFFVKSFATPSALTTGLVIPLPDWLNRIIFGRGSLANPLIYSALIPGLLSIIAIGAKAWRPVVGGVSFGFAGLMLYAAWAHAPALAWLPFTFLAIPWLVTNALICLFLGRVMVRREAP
jgi:serine protease